MIPNAIPRQAKSGAEAKLFEVLSNMEGWDEWICLHSLRLDEHSYQACGEIDFLFLGPEGIFACEVKGGRVSFNGKIWTMKNRFGHDHNEHRGPFKQSEDAHFSLKADLLKIPSLHNLIPKVRFGWFVSFPEIEFDVDSVEWSKEIISDIRTCSSPSLLSLKLKHMLDYYQSKFPNKKTLSREDIEDLLVHMRPKFDRIPKLGDVAIHLLGESFALTQEQYLFLDAVFTNPKIICNGGAGTGKSFIGLEAARRMYALGKSVVFTTKSDTLLAYLKNQPNVEGIDFVPWSNIESVKPVDYLVIDEAQDVIDEDAPNILNSVVKGGGANGSWLICMDRNSQSNLIGTYSKSAMDRIDSFKSISVNIPVNCRNTLLILNQTKWATGADMGIRGIGDGPTVTWQPVMDIKSEAALLESHLKKLLMEERLEPKQITVLVLNEKHNALNYVSEQLRSRVKEISPTLIENWNDRPITWSSVPAFKGLENIAICIVGAHELNDLRSPINSLYVAMSRAQAFLWIATTQELGELVKSSSGGHFE
jgi:hypothetical protein